MATTSRTTLRCRVCGFTEIRTDLVLDPGPVLLASCLRCDHRFTSRAELEARSPARVRPRRESEPDLAVA